MNTKQLKAKVLDLAIHGKLLSPETVAELKKSPDYETADVLLEKIRKEKEEKIAKGELKRDKKDSYIFVGDDKRHYEKFADGTVKDIEDEIPFDVPEGWAWASLSEIANIYTGNSINENEKANKYSNLKEGLFYIATKDIDFEGKINYNNGIRIPLAESKFKIAPAESTLLCIEGGSAGRKIGFINQDVCFVNKLCSFHSDHLSNLYLFYYLQSRTFIDLFNSNKSGLIGGVSLNLLKSIFIPVAPAIEQDLISKTIATYLEKITTLNKDKETLELTIKKAKSKILDLAIHGKLVPQDSNDEPASVLFEKLRAEKEDKIAKGELKRDKNDSYIYKGSDNCYYQRFADGREEDISDEIPFEVPSNWTWTRIGAISNKITDGEHNTPKRVSTFQGFYLLSARNIQNGYISLNDVDYVDEDEFLRIHKRCNPQKGDVLISCSGSVGRCTVIEDNNKYVMVRSAAMISSTVINTKYLMYVIQSQELQNQIEDSSKQTAQANLFQAAITDLLIPLPPSNEQNRIINKIEELYIKLELIIQNID